MALLTNAFDRLSAGLADRYRIERELGAGGMATVYLAHDLKHDRDVAIKVLHPDLGAALGAERFLSEIKTTAKLQHPHILALLDSGAADGLLYYVMPLVTGETLRARLERERQLPIADALRIAREVASALDYAHRQGVIHRDIKPENILLHDGQAIVADFGIALAVQSAGGQRMTQTGLSLGTPQYMSPEQAMGDRTVDVRSDIYALGAVTYEMLTGDAPFTGSSVQAIVARVLTEKPQAISTVRDTVPVGAEQAVLRALSKLPADRFESAKEFIDALGREGQPTVVRTGATAASARTSRGLLAGTALLAIVGGLGWFAWWRASRGDRAAAALPLRFTVEQPSGATIGDGNAFSLDISSAARRVAFIARDSAGVARVYVRAFNDVRAQRLDGTEGVNVLFFSPDGAWIAFVGDGKLKKILATGGNAIVLADYGDRPSGGAWSSDGQIYVPAERSILVIPENGGVAQSLGTLVETGRYVRSPRVLADGGTLLFTDWGGTAATARIMAYSLPEKSFAPIGVEGSVALAVRDTLLIYSDANGAINSMAYDATRRTAQGEIRQLINTVGSWGGFPRAALAADGSLAYFLGEQTSALTLVGPGDAVESLRGGLDAAEPRVSLDGKRIVMFSNAVSDVRTYDIEARSLTRNAFGPASATVYSRPEWMANGALLLRAESGTERAVLVRQAANDRGVPAVLHRDAQNSLWEGVVSPDGQFLLYRVGTGNESDIRYRPMTGDSASRPFVATPAREQEARFSPNGQWVAYNSNESGEEAEVYVRPFPDGAKSYRISEAGGRQPVWARDGQSLYYVASDGLLLRARLDIVKGARGDAPVAGGPAVVGPRVTARDTVVRGGFDLPLERGHATYDVMPDGRLVLMRPMQGGQSLVVAYGWLGALRAEWAKAAR